MLEIMKIRYHVSKAYLKDRKKFYTHWSICLKMSISSICTKKFADKQVSKSFLY